VDPAGGTTPIGRDGVARGGKAPKIARGIAAVNATFSAVGDVEIVAAVKVAANPVNGHATARARRVRYPVKVWAPGDLGSATGSVVDEANGTPLPGLRVLALDAATLQPVSAAITRLDGTYEILRLPPGDYLVGVRGGRGFEGEFFDDAPDPSTATTISVTAGAQVTGIDFVLSRISGF